MNISILRSLGTLVVILSLIGTVTYGGDFGNNNNTFDTEGFTKALSKKLENDGAYLKFCHKINFSKTNKSEKNTKAVGLQKLLDNGVIRETNTNPDKNANLFEKYLTKKFSQNDYYDTIIVWSLCTKGIDLTLENINKVRNEFYDTLQLMTKEELEFSLHEVLENRIRRDFNRKEEPGALYTEDKKYKVKDAIEAYSAIKKLSIEGIRKCVNNVRSKDHRDIFHLFVLTSYYDFITKLSFPPIKVIQ